MDPTNSPTPPSMSITDAQTIPPTNYPTSHTLNPSLGPSISPTKNPTDSPISFMTFKESMAIRIPLLGLLLLVLIILAIKLRVVHLISRKKDRSAVDTYRVSRIPIKGLEALLIIVLLFTQLDKVFAIGEYLNS